MPHTLKCCTCSCSSWCLECSPDALSTPETPQGTRILWNWVQRQLPLKRFSSNSLFPSTAPFYLFHWMIPLVLYALRCRVQPSDTALVMLFCDYATTVIKMIRLTWILRSDGRRLGLLRWTDIPLLLAVQVCVGYYSTPLRISSLSLNGGITEPPCKVVEIKWDHAGKFTGHGTWIQKLSASGSRALSVGDCLRVCDLVILRSGIMVGSCL